MNDYLGSNDEINLENGKHSIQLAKALTKDFKNNFIKICIVYWFIIFFIKYDQKESDLITKGKLKKYKPYADEVFATLKGICWDYSVLFATMLRGIGIPTKVVKGYADYAPTAYHAWNEVWVNGKWQTVDTTYAAYHKLSPMFRKTSKYNKKKES